MKLIDRTVADFTQELASPAPVPGGGGASALAAAIGVSLGDMVGELTVGKKRYADVEEDICGLMERSQALRLRFLELVDGDAEAFAPLAKAYGTKGSKIAISDAGCGAILCKAAMQAASLNVFINTKSMKDRTCAEALEEEANALLAKYTILGDAVFNKVSDRIRG